MAFELIHFRDIDKLIIKKKLKRDLSVTLSYVADVLTGTIYRGELLRQALEEMGWREKGSLGILENRRYAFKGFKKNIAIEGSFASYEYIQEGLFRLQVGFDKGKIEGGILMLTAERSDKSKLGTSRLIAVAEVEALYPTISLPVSVVLFTLGPPVISSGEEEGGDEQNGVSVHANEGEEAPEVDQGA